MKAKLCLAVLVLLAFGAVSANALACMWCDCTMECSRGCRDTTTWQVTTCGAWGDVCIGRPACLAWIGPENPLSPSGNGEQFAGIEPAVCSEPATVTP